MMMTTKPKMRIAASGWRKVATENAIAMQMALAKFKLGDLGTQGGAGLRAVYLCGPPGVGKTKSIVDQEAIWRSRGISPLRFRPKSANELLEYFEKARGVRPLIMEEADIIFRSKPMFEVLKKATDKETPDIEHRIVKIDGEKVMVPFRIDAPVIVSTNMNLLGTAGWDANLLPERDALFDRSMPVVIPDDPHALWEWSIYLAITSDLTRNVTLRNPSGGKPLTNANPLSVQAIAMDWFTDHIQHIAVISPRTLKKVAELFGRLHRRDLPSAIFNSELQALLSPTARRDVAVPIKADWATLLITMPRLRTPATVGNALTSACKSGAKRQNPPALGLSTTGLATTAPAHARRAAA